MVYLNSIRPRWLHFDLHQETGLLPRQRGNMLSCCLVCLLGFLFSAEVVNGTHHHCCWLVHCVLSAWNGINLFYIALSFCEVFSLCFSQTILFFLSLFSAEGGIFVAIIRVFTLPVTEHRRRQKRGYRRLHQETEPILFIPLHN